MTRNMGTGDRTIRFLIGVAIGVLYFTGTIGGMLAIVLGTVAVLFLVTGLLGWYPGFLPFGLSTRKAPGGSQSAA